MNKQQLAAKIWESANQMRSKIEANEYKDYILGFIFYKYLSDKLVSFAISQDFSKEDIESLSEGDKETVDFFKSNLGYFIGNDHLFSTWLESGSDFDVANVRTALSAFSRLIHPDHKRLFDGIFKTLETGLSKLGDTAAKQTKAISDLIQLIKDIPMDGRQGYDVLGFIYEYLISMFAANAGKKAGEFYTPHEVSVLMSEIIAAHVKGKDTIDIYDSTSGSGSLLLNIGESIAKHMGNEGNIKYFAQELKENTYNLTRMNLIMRGILPSNIFTRNGDTLEDDWPFFDDNDPVNSYNPLYLDAVVSNPPYSQQWDPEYKENDPRYARFGLAPKSKADYAFLLHDLYHLKPDGIMAIVLPHGVLFRGGEEGQIRKQLIENEHLDTIIGLPANIFFGTGIPTTILVLKQKRENSDVLIVDASKGFIKEGKNNKLRACDIKKICDTVIGRHSLPGYSQVVSKEEIRENDYNLNIPRYVDSSEQAESWDIYASMFGGIPKSELDVLNNYWKAFPTLREELFYDDGTPYVMPKVDDFAQAIRNHAQVQGFEKNFVTAFADFPNYLKKELIGNMLTLHVPRQKSIIGDEVFTRLMPLTLIDKYQAYQLLSEQWSQIAIDLEILQTEGFDAARIVDPNLVIKKKDGKDVEVQDGWKGRIMPFELVQTTYLKKQLDALCEQESRLSEISVSLDDLILSLSEPEGEYSVLNDANDKFVTSEVNHHLKELLKEVESEEIRVLRSYLALLDTKAKKPAKEAFIAAHPEVRWSRMEAAKDGTYAKVKVNNYIIELQSAFEFPEDSFAYKLINASALLSEEKELKATIKNEAAALHLLTKETIEGLSDIQVNDLLERKWILPLHKTFHQLPEQQLEALANKLQTLVEKYQVTYADNAREIKKTETMLAGILDELNGNDFDMKGISELKTFFEGHKHD
ncbi:type I restriction-modification system subunit M [Aeromonas media]|uniref:site-specific DNA-methyltransferase (adenine-specific) n=1 Tax=Aeromonas media TaxID=651 RepID=A0AAP6GB41_AERME|nr:type I restriction-modification system subunit M [Aeromonas media]MDX7921933.1 type I restriction-modification system subunit M [Aeromonas media]